VSLGYPTGRQWFDATYGDHAVVAAAA